MVAKDFEGLDFLLTYSDAVLWGECLDRSERPGPKGKESVFLFKILGGVDRKDQEFVNRNLVTVVIESPLLKLAQNEQPDFKVGEESVLFLNKKAGNWTPSRGILSKFTFEKRDGGTFLKLPFQQGDSGNLMALALFQERVEEQYKIELKKRFQNDLQISKRNRPQDQGGRGLASEKQGKLSEEEIRENDRTLAFLLVIILGFLGYFSRREGHKD